jgi:putative hydrolase of the HAD superfamily
MFGGRFHHEFISYRTGFMKPDSAAYENVLSVLGCPAEEVLFFDDSPECVEGARRVRIRGHVAQGVSEVAAVLQAEGLLPDKNGP